MKMHTNRTLTPGPSPKRQLFIDTDTLVDWDINIEHRVHQAEKVQITGLECGQPRSWDARCTVAWGSTHVENGVFRKWYCCIPDASDYGENVDHWLVCYAESDDGVRWRKPDLKLVGHNRWPGNNLIPLPGCVIGVERALPQAGCKYVAASIQIAPLEPDVCDNAGLEFNGGGTYMFGSDDGLHWHQLTKYPIIQHGDIGCFHADPIKKRYMLYQKMGTNHAMTLRRSALIIESEDLVHWTGYDGYRQWQETFTTDDYDDMIAAQRGYRIAEYYSYTLHQVDRIYLAVQNLFTVALPLRNVAGQNPNGASHFRVAFSHDGKHWRHPHGRQPLLEVGKPGQFDSGFLVNSGNLVEHGDDYLLYYSALRYAHGWCITPEFQMRKDIPFADQRRYQEYCGLAKIKRDRFAGFAFSWKGRFDIEIGSRQGEELLINAECLKGQVRVAIAQQSSPYHLERRKDESLPGFSFDDCVPFTGDSARAPVRFRNASVASIPADMRLVLRFEVSAGEVFGYEWV